MHFGLRTELMSRTVFYHRNYRFFFFSREESRMLGVTNKVEVQGISAHGFWLLLKEREIPNY